MFSHNAENKTIRGFAVKYLIKWKLRTGRLVNLFDYQRSKQQPRSK
jgi:hypothetical protein